MIERGHDYLRARRPTLRQHATMNERQRCHVLAEYDFVRARSIKKCYERALSLVHNLAGFLACPELAADIAVRTSIIINFRLNAGLGNLCSAWSNQEDGRR